MDRAGHVLACHFVGQWEKSGKPHCSPCNRRARLTRPIAAINEAQTKWFTRFGVGIGRAAMCNRTNGLGTALPQGRCAFLKMEKADGW